MSKPIQEQEVAGFLEDLLQGIQEDEPQSIAVAYRDKEGDVTTGYWNCTPEEKGTLANHIQSDMMFQIMKANAGRIIAAAEESDDEEAAE